MDTYLRAGLAIYNAGEFHAAHDAWEDYWLGLDSGTADERFLHGLIQFTAVVHHTTDSNWTGIRGLAESAAAYLGDLPGEYRGVDVETVRSYLRAVRDDPEYVERVAPPRLTDDGAVLRPDDLDFEESAVAALVLAEEFGYEESVLERAIEFARMDLEAGDEGSRFITFVMDFVRQPENRALIFQRLSQHVERREFRETDVDGLFE
ncbi:DUF309 domain-containing protein [Haladaptatus sp. AB618]|uniref:DUF309 domain-containing protein n=1 Tax=Haladaptatus sp. AB618 TaxID=2934173 RepID=UPI00209C2951|nr:DUF309 domain-containing protein [Haladaptatus sp. AB618]MCO8253557.1 DUF309 domain-containing protein [Haladaptatus sp. AB618]